MRWMVCVSTCLSVESVSSRFSHQPSKKFSAMILHTIDRRGPAIHSACIWKVSARGRRAACHAEPNSHHRHIHAANQLCFQQRQPCKQGVANQTAQGSHLNQGDQSRPLLGCIICRSSGRVTYLVSCLWRRAGVLYSACMLLLVCSQPLVVGSSDSEHGHICCPPPHN